MSREKPNYDKFKKMAILPEVDSEEAGILERNDWKTFMTLGLTLKKIREHIPEHVLDALHEKVRNGNITTENEAIQFLAGAGTVLSAITGDGKILPVMWVINAMSGRSVVEGDPDLTQKLNDNKPFYVVLRGEIELELRRTLEEYADIRYFIKDQCPTPTAMNNFVWSLMESLDESYERADIKQMLNTQNFTQAVREAYNSFLSYMEE